MSEIEPLADWGSEKPMGTTTESKLVTNKQLKHALDNLPQASTTDYGAVKLVNDSELSEIKTGLTAGGDTDSIAITQGDVSCATFEVTGSCSNKTVTLGGEMIISYSGAPVNNGDVVFRLPAGYRPSQQIDISMIGARRLPSSSIVAGPYNFIIKTNGDVVYNDTSLSSMYSINPGDAVNDNPVTFEVGNYVPSDIVPSKLLTVPQMLDLFATNGGSSGGGLELLWEGKGSSNFSIELDNSISYYSALLFSYIENYLPTIMSALVPVSFLADATECPAGYSPQYGESSIVVTAANGIEGSVIGVIPQANCVIVKVYGLKASGGGGQ